MKNLSRRYFKFTLVFVGFIFTLSLVHWMGDGLFLKPSLAEAANPAIGLTKDNPGIRTAIQVQNKHTERLMGIPGVVGHGVGISSDGEPVIKIFVARAGIPGIPSALEGVPTKVEVTGMVIAYVDRTARFPRPVPIGVSTGHPDITAGTIGCRVIDTQGNVYALSNNHIYANENDASIGDNVLQPGPYDGGQDPGDAIGTLYDFEPIFFDGRDNTIDAAIAISSESDLGCSTPVDGYVIPGSDPVAASIGLDVQKYGRTTGLTQGEVSEIGVTVDVCYQTKGPFLCVKSAKFVDQIAITPGEFAAGGDSGSLIVTYDTNKNPVGLLFAGSSTRTIANPIGLVLNHFNVMVDDSSTPPPENQPPYADFSFYTDGLDVQFEDNSTDSDGDVVTWDWKFGDGSGTSTIQNPSYTYTASGTYTVTLAVTDDDEATGSTSKEVVVSSGGEFTLTATGYKVKGRHHADLEWSGATSDNVDIYRDGALIATTNNSGDYTDSTNYVGGGSYTYQICEAGSTTTCSNEATVIF